ncbi:MAG: cofactor-independent phosphoglycerate mutase [Planctomycetes bacterium]|nr:cofactor-independent phosphoglycerate mutase [Planctomycetota bacterium]
MKHVLVLPDGAADEPVPAQGGRTPLEAADKPNIDWIARHGRQGLVTTIPEGFAPGSDVATLSLLGYNPAEYYSGRAPLEAAAQGLRVGGNAVVFRCNFVTLGDGRMIDFTAGHISSTEGGRLIEALEEGLSEPRCRFHAGVSYRNLLVVSPADDLEPRCTPPHDIPDQPVAAYLPTGDGAVWLRGLMDRAHDLLAAHEVNEARRAAGLRAATDIWLWGQGRPRPFQPFAERFGVRAACIAAVDLIRGLARCAGMDVIDVPGATGYFDTDYAAKGRAVAAALKTHDLVVVHVEAPDEAGHQGDFEAKVAALQAIDRFVVGPALDALRSYPAWSILVAPDHPTPVVRRVHTATPPPFCLTGTHIAERSDRPFSEASAASTGLHVHAGHELLKQLRLA